MISPASGIHRPSYNGAPAIQTPHELDDELLLRFNSQFVMRVNVRGAAPNRSNTRL
jgi:hypothetical protein